MNRTLEPSVSKASAMPADVVWVGSSLAFETRPHTCSQTGHLLLTDPESKYRGVYIFYRGSVALFGVLEVN